MNKLFSILPLNRKYSGRLFAGVLGTLIIFQATAFSLQSQKRLVPVWLSLEESGSSLQKFPKSGQYHVRSSLFSVLKEPDEADSNFGRMGFWNQCYEEEDEFSWYAEWNDIQPFFSELVPPNNDLGIQPRVLLPGIGNDKSMVDMYDFGYSEMTAYDYAPEGVECAKRFFGDRVNNGCNLQVADARDLPYDTDSFDAILEKGTLDAVFLSGARDKDLAAEYLDMAVSEMARVIRPGGVVMSITAAAADAVQESFAKLDSKWKVLRDGGFYVTDDGYTSNNIDATIFVWERM